MCDTNWPIIYQIITNKKGQKYQLTAVSISSGVTTTPTPLAVSKALISTSNAGW